MGKLEVREYNSDTDKLKAIKSKLGVRSKGKEHQKIDKDLPINHGIYEGISNARYHSEEFKEYVTAHGIGKLLLSPAHYEAFLKENIQTPAMAVGSAAHLLILEDDLDSIAIFPGKSRYGKAYEDFAETTPKEKSIVLQSEFDSIKTMQSVIKTHKLAMAFINNPKAMKEISVFCEHDRYEGILCKIRPDIAFELDYEMVRPMNKSVIELEEEGIELTKVNGIIADYKSARSATYDDFQKAIINYGYDIQAAWYIDVMKIYTGLEWNFIWIVQEKEMPWAIQCYLATEELIELGRIKINTALELYWYCKNGDGFGQAYPEELKEIYPPAWATK